MLSAAEILEPVKAPLQWANDAVCVAGREVGFPPRHPLRVPTRHIYSLSAARVHAKEMAHERHAPSLVSVNLWRRELFGRSRVGGAILDRWVDSRRRDSVKTTLARNRVGMGALF